MHILHEIAFTFSTKMPHATTHTHAHACRDDMSSKMSCLFTHTPCRVYLFIFIK